MCSFVDTCAVDHIEKASFPLFSGLCSRSALRARPALVQVRVRVRARVCALTVYMRAGVYRVGGIQMEEFVTHLYDEFVRSFIYRVRDSFICVK